MVSPAVGGAIEERNIAGTEETNADAIGVGIGSPDEVKALEDGVGAGAEKTGVDLGGGRVVGPAEAGAIEDRGSTVIEEAEKVGEVTMGQSEINFCLFRRFSADGVLDIEDAALGGDVREDGSIGRGGEDPVLQEEEWDG